jgi:hypothetical protein
VALRDPLHIYDAASNDDALFARMYLESNAIEAFEVDHNSVVGNWLFGRLPGIHKPQVWVERADAERARTCILKYEADRREREGVGHSIDDDTPVQVVCEDCAKPSTFPASQLGTLQDCPHCGAYVDVGDVESFEE